MMLLKKKLRLNQVEIKEYQYIEPIIFMPIGIIEEWGNFVLINTQRPATPWPDTEPEQFNTAAPRIR